ncbi:MAG: LD-carboxypeptidase [Lachnospiraceae bacterium]|nr:LD-carboxypeptidase [Lachnospiraceae bacterium]
MWKYCLGCERLKEMGLSVVAAPNSLRRTAYLKENPQARAEDILWTFENKEIRGALQI